MRKIESFNSKKCMDVWTFKKFVRGWKANWSSWVIQIFFYCFNFRDQLFSKSRFLLWILIYIKQDSKAYIWCKQNMVCTILKLVLLVRKFTNFDSEDHLWLTKALHNPAFGHMTWSNNKELRSLTSVGQICPTPVM